MFWPPGSIWEIWNLPCGMATPNRTVNVPSESVLKAPSKGFIGKQRISVEKGKSNPPAAAKTFFKIAGFRADASFSGSRGFQPSTSNNRSSLGQNPKSQLHITFTARGAAYLIPKKVSPNFQLEKCRDNVASKESPSH